MLGLLLAVNTTGVTVLNSLGYQYNLMWNGTVNNRQTWYSGSSCTGTAVLNGSVGSITYGKIVFRSTAGQFYKITTSNANFESVAGAGITAASIDNVTSGCTASTGGTGWPVTAITSTSVGIPATIVPPLQFP